MCILLNHSTCITDCPGIQEELARYFRCPFVIGMYMYLEFHVRTTFYPWNVVLRRQRTSHGRCKYVHLHLQSRQNLFCLYWLSFYHRCLTLQVVL